MSGVFFQQYRRTEIFLRPSQDDFRERAVLGGCPLVFLEYGSLGICYGRGGLRAQGGEFSSAAGM